MLLMLWTVMMMVGIGSGHFLIGDRRSPRSVGRERRVLRLLPLAIGLALVSIPAGAWAQASSDPSAEIQQTRPIAAPIGTEARPAPEKDYASREASAKSLEKFQGGDTIVIGSSVLIVILIVVLIVVLI